MNKTKIDWCDSTWNPVTGCVHGCEYCYARGIADRFGSFETIDGDNIRVLNTGATINCVEVKERAKTPYPEKFAPTFHRYHLADYEKKAGRNVFVCSMADLFGSWVPDSWIEEVFEACKKAPQHNYLFLTKNPARYIELESERKLPWFDNYWFGSSVTKLSDKYTWFTEKKFHWFLSVEPILEDLGAMDADAPKPELVIVGAETGKRKDKVVPERKWIDNLLAECRKYGIPLFMKSSLADIWGEPLIQEFPAQLMREPKRKQSKKKARIKILKRMWRICNNPRCNDWNNEPEHIAVPYEILEEKEKSYVCIRAGWHQQNVLAKNEFYDSKEACEAEIRRRNKEGWK